MASKWKICLSGACVAVVLWFYPPSLMRSEVGIRNSLLKQTPLGSSFDQVRSFAERQGWRPHGEWNGFQRQEAGKLPETVGVTSIEAEVGRYWLPFCTTVTAFWGFDSEGRLIDVWVWKTTDSP